MAKKNEVRSAKEAEQEIAERKVLDIVNRNAEEARRREEAREAERVLAQQKARTERAIERDIEKRRNAIETLLQAASIVSCLIAIIGIGFAFRAVEYWFAVAVSIVAALALVAILACTISIILRKGREVRRA